MPPVISPTTAGNPIRLASSAPMRAIVTSRASWMSRRNTEWPGRLGTCTRAQATTRNLGCYTRACLGPDVGPDPGPELGREIGRSGPAGSRARSGADRSVSAAALLRGLSRSGEHQLRRAGDAARPASHRQPVRVRRRNLFLRVLPVRDPGDADGRSLERTEVDRAHPGRLGAGGLRDGLHQDAAAVLLAAFPAGRRRGWVLPGGG